MGKKKTLTVKESGKLGGTAKKEKYGKKVFSTMSASSWKNGSSPARIATRVIQAAATSFAAGERRHIKAGVLVRCTVCSEPISKSSDLAFTVPDYNHPRDVFCSHKKCSKKNVEKVPLKSHNAMKIANAYKAAVPGTPSMDILKEAARHKHRL